MKKKASFLNQIYFIVGGHIEKSYLENVAKKKGIIDTEVQINIYLEIGGQPRLDQDYTVFGKVYEGLNIFFNIAKLQTKELNIPIQEIPFLISIIEE